MMIFFVFMLIFVFALMVFVLIRMKHRAVGYFEIVVAAIFECVGHIEAADVASVAKRARITVIHSLCFCSDAQRVCLDIGACDGVVDNVHYAAARAVGI